MYRSEPIIFPGATAPASLNQPGSISRHKSSSLLRKTQVGSPARNNHACFKKNLPKILNERIEKSEFIEDVLEHQKLQDFVRIGAARQKAIAENALRDPSVQRVTEQKEGALHNVVVERRDGTIETHLVNGTKITKTKQYKLTEFPRTVNVSVLAIKEYVSGAVESTYRNGSTLFTPQGGTKSYRYAPDGTTIKTC